MASPRTAQISRNTNETKIEVSINLDCQPGNAANTKQEIQVSTGIGFLDHVCCVLLLQVLVEQIQTCVPDVSCTCKAFWNVSDHEMRR